MDDMVRSALCRLIRFPRGGMRQPAVGSTDDWPSPSHPPACLPISDGENKISHHLLHSLTELRGFKSIQHRSSIRMQSVLMVSDERSRLRTNKLARSIGFAMESVQPSAHIRMLAIPAMAIVALRTGTRDYRRTACISTDQMLLPTLIATSLLTAWNRYHHASGQCEPCA